MVSADRIKAIIKLPVVARFGIKVVPGWAAYAVGFLVGLLGASRLKTAAKAYLDEVDRQTLRDLKLAAWKTDIGPGVIGSKDRFGGFNLPRSLPRKNQILSTAEAIKILSRIAEEFHTEQADAGTKFAIVQVGLDVWIANRCIGRRHFCLSRSRTHRVNIVRSSRRAK
jgi:hypothetical protein